MAHFFLSQIPFWKLVLFFSETVDYDSNFPTADFEDQPRMRRIYSN